MVKKKDIAGALGVSPAWRRRKVDDTQRLLRQADRRPADVTAVAFALGARVGADAVTQQVAAAAAGLVRMYALPPERAANFALVALAAAWRVALVAERLTDADIGKPAREAGLLSEGEFADGLLILRDRAATDAPAMARELWTDAAAD